MLKKIKKIVLEYHKSDNESDFDKLFQKISLTHDAKTFPNNGLEGMGIIIAERK